MEKQQKSKKATILIGALVTVILSLLLCLVALSPDTFEGVKNITVNISHTDGTVYTEEIKTTSRYLIDILEAHDLITGERSDEYGYVIISADGEKADFSAGQYWAFLINGSSPESELDLLQVTDGDTYAFYTYTY